MHLWKDKPIENSNVVTLLILIVSNIPIFCLPALLNTTAQPFIWSINRRWPPLTILPCPGRELCLSVVSSLRACPISHRHSSSEACCLAASTCPLTRLSVKWLEFVRNTVSWWQLPADLTRASTRRRADPLGVYHHVNNDTWNEWKHYELWKQPVACL